MTFEIPVLNDHATQRAAQRNLSPQAIQFVLSYGERLNRAGAIFYFLRECDLAYPHIKDDELRRLIGTAIVLSKDESQVLTVWRNRKDGLNRIERKSKFDIPKR